MDDLLESGSGIEKLIVVHPAIKPVEAYILYVAYEGWFSSGRPQWSIDKLILTDHFGKKMSFCKEIGQVLLSGMPVRLKLKDGDCIGTSLGPPDYKIIKPNEKVKNIFVAWHFLLVPQPHIPLCRRLREVSQQFV